MAIEKNLSINQGSTFKEKVFLNEGYIFNILGIETSDNPEFTLSHNHGFVTNDFVHLIDVKTVPFIEDNIVQVKQPEDNRFSIDSSISYVEVSKDSKAILATNLSGYNFAGEIRQNRLESLPNILASIEANSREIILKGSLASIDAGDYLVLPEAGFTKESPVKVLQFYTTNNRTFRDSRISVAVVNRPASNTVSNQALKVSTRKLATFNILNTSLSKGLITITLDSVGTEALPPNNKSNPFYYDIKAQKPDGDIDTLLYGKVNVIPQITPNNIF